MKVIEVQGVIPLTPSRAIDVLLVDEEENEKHKKEQKERNREQLFNAFWSPSGARFYLVFGILSTKKPHICQYETSIYHLMLKGKKCAVYIYIYINYLFIYLLNKDQNPVTAGSARINAKEREIILVLLSVEISN